MHTQHAATGGQHPEHDSTLTWYGRAYTREARPDYTMPPDHLPPPFPRALAGNLWLAVLSHMVEEMPTPLVPATVLGSATGEGLAMQELRNEIMLPSTKADVKDAAWRYVVTQVRQVRHDWTYFAIGLALPGIWNAAKRLAPERKTPFWRVALVHRKMATEFVDAMGKAELDRPYIVARLIGQAFDAVREHGRAKAPSPAFDLAMLDYLDPYARAENSRHQHKSNYLDALIALAKLVRDTASNKPGRILTVTDAQLIAYTYIDGHTLAQAAPWVNLTEPAARMRRDRARKLVANLLDGKTGRRPLPEPAEPEPADQPTAPAD